MRAGDLKNWKTEGGKEIVRAGKHKRSKRKLSK